MPWGLSPVVSEIPLVTVTENAGLFLEGAMVSGCLQTSWKARSASGQAPELGACSSVQISCPVLRTPGKCLPLCLLPARG